MLKLDNLFDLLPLASYNVKVKLIANSIQMTIHSTYISILLPETMTKRTTKLENKVQH